MIRKDKKPEPLFSHVADYDGSLYRHHWHIVFTNNISSDIRETLEYQGATEEEIEEHLDSENSDSVTAKVCFIKLKNKKSFNIAIFDINKYTNNTGVHEAFHITKEILFTRGMVIDETGSSEEPYAYLLGDVFDNIHINYKVAMSKYRLFKKELKNEKYVSTGD